MITLVSSPKQHLCKHIQHSVNIFLAPLCSNKNSTETLSTKGWAYCMQFPIWDIVWMAPTSCWIQCRKQHWKSGLGFQGLWVRNIEHQDNSEIKELYALVWAKNLRSRQDQRKLLEWHILNCFKLAEQKALESDKNVNFESPSKLDSRNGF